jgi:hypothetical protein
MEVARGSALSICLHTSPSDGHSARNEESGWGVDSSMRKAWLFKWQPVQPPLSFATPMVHKLEEGKIPTRALKDLNPKSPQAGSTCFTCQKPASRGDGLVPTVLVKVQAWYLAIYFRVGDLTGNDRWIGIEPPDTHSLGTLLILALAKSAPTLAGSKLALEWLLTHREPMWSWWRITSLSYAIGSDPQLVLLSSAWAEHRSRTGTMRLCLTGPMNNEGPEVRQ